MRKKTLLVFFFLLTLWPIQIIQLQPMSNEFDTNYEPIDQSQYQTDNKPQKEIKNHTNNGNHYGQNNNHTNNGHHNNQTENDTMTEIGQFQDLADAATALEGNVNIRNIGFSDSKIWWTTISGNVITINSLPQNDLTAVPTAVTTLTGNAANARNHLLRAYGNFIIAGITTYNGAGSGYINARYSIDGGSSWNNTTLVTLTDYSNLGEIRLVDFVDLRATPDQCYLATQKTGVTSYLIENNFSGTVRNFYIYHEDGQYGGVQRDGHYFCVKMHGPDEIKIEDYTLSTGYKVTEILDDLLTPANFNTDVQQYHQNANGDEFIMDEDHLYFRNKNSDVWQSKTASGTSTNGVCWNTNSDDEYEIKFIAWDDKIFEIFAGGEVYPIQDISLNAYVGYGDELDEAFFTTGSSIIQYTDVEVKNGIDLVFGDANCNYNSNECYLDELKGKDVWKENDLVNIYEDSVIIFKGIVEYSDLINRVIKLRHPIKFDLDLTVTLTSPATLEYVLENTLKFCGQNVSAITVPVCTNKTIREILNDAVKDGAYVWYVTQDPIIYVNAGTTTGTPSATSGVSHVVPTREVNTISSVTVIYANNDSVTVYRTGVSGITLTYHFPLIITQSDAEDKADALLLALDVEILEIDCWVDGQGPFQIGHKTQFVEDSDSDLVSELGSEASYYIIGSQYESDEDRSKITIVNLLTGGKQTYNTSLKVSDKVDSVLQGNYKMQGNLDFDAHVITSNDADLLWLLGRAAIGYNGYYTDDACFAHRDMMNRYDYAVRQDENGYTLLNAKTAKYLGFCINDSWIGKIDINGLTMNSKPIISPLDPTAGNHVGDRDYNDDRYILEEHFMAKSSAGLACPYNSISAAYNFNTVDFDLDSNWDAVNKRFVANCDGIYHVDIKITLDAWSGSVNQLFSIKLYKNGVFYTNIATAWYDSTGSTRKTAVGSMSIELDETDYIDFRVFQNRRNPTGYVFASADYNLLSISLIHKL